MIFIHCKSAARKLIVTVYPEFSDFVAGANFKNIRRLLQ